MLPRFIPVAGLRPFALGVIVASYFWAFAWLLREVDGTFGLRQGGEYEEATSEALRQLRKHGWYVEDNVSFAGYDVDHVAVGQAGVFVFETKYTSLAWKISSAGLVGPYRDPIAQACFGAKRIRQLLLSKGVDVVAVTPVVAVWGRRMQEIEGGAKSLPGVDGFGKVVIVNGRQHKEWMARMAGAPSRLEPGTVEAVREVLQDFKRAKALSDR